MVYYGMGMYRFLLLTSFEIFWHLLTRLCYGLRRKTSSNLAAARRANRPSASSRAKTPPRRISWSWCPAQPFLATPNWPSMGGIKMLVNHQTMVGKNYWRLTCRDLVICENFILKQFDFRIFYDCYAIAIKMSCQTWPPSSNEKSFPERFPMRSPQDFRTGDISSAALLPPWSSQISSWPEAKTDLGSG